MRHSDGIEALVVSAPLSSTGTLGARALISLKFTVKTKKGTQMGTLFNWWSQTGSNRRPQHCQCCALPAELWPQFSLWIYIQPQSVALSCATPVQLSYGPI
jgi:hypothetical protein